MKLIFDWDARKDRANLKKHKIRFDEAKTIFLDPYVMTYPDKFHSDYEERYISIGYSTRNRILLAVHTEYEQEEDTLVIRIISSRKATPEERKNMKKTKTNDDEMLEEYDFTGMKGVRGKYHEAYKKGHTVRIHEDDGTVSIHHYTLEDGAVLLEPDIRPYFPTSESVNEVLRSLIQLAPQKVNIS